MTNIKEKSYAFVLDNEGKRLSPTNENKAWFLIRKKRAILVNKFPMVIQLTKVVKLKEIDKTEIMVGIDDGGKHTGIALVQQCENRNKPIFKGTIELRQDVKHLMKVRKGYRSCRRQEKRYRPKRFLNRANSKRKERVASSIKQKRESTLRVVNNLAKYIRMDGFVAEDVKIDIRAITEGFKPYRWQYQKSNRLDENIRKAVIMRDNNTCVLCGRTDCEIENHHILSRRDGGADSVNNLCCLCKLCHRKVTGHEKEYEKQLYELIDGRKFDTKPAHHVMQGKNYLYNNLRDKGKLTLTTGGDTANHRIDWEIEKTHSNDAIVICGLKVDSKNVNIKDWIIKPMRRQQKGLALEVCGFRHRDLVRYTKRNGDFYDGYITALYPEKNQFNLTDFDGKTYKRDGLKNASLMWRFNKIYYI